MARPQCALVYYTEMYYAFVLLEGNDGISPITVLIIIT